MVLFIHFNYLSYDDAKLLMLLNKSVFNLVCLSIVNFRSFSQYSLSWWRFTNGNWRKHGINFESLRCSPLWMKEKTTINTMSKLLFSREMQTAHHFFMRFIYI